MSKVQKTAQAGTLESNDILITVAPGNGAEGIVLELQSIVMPQFGDSIRRTITKVIAEQGLTDVHVVANDRGALDCTIQARVLTALSRAGVALKEVAG